MSTGEFALVDVDDAGKVLCTAIDVAGFFATPRDSEPWWTFRLLGCTVSAEVVGNTELRVLGADGQPIGAYHLSTVTVDESTPHSADTRLVDLTVTGWLLGSAPEAEAEPVWRWWQRGHPVTPGLWREFSPAGWLEVVRMHARWAPRVERPVGAVDLDGSAITDKDSFYCALGEAVHGPGGYYGADLDGLADCLNGAFGVRAPFTLTWHDSQIAESALGTGYVAKILDVFQARNVPVRLKPSQED